MKQLLPSIACNLDSNILLASLPLFSSEKVHGIEWSFDTLFHLAEIPDWYEELLQTYSQANQLVGHGVFFSLFSGRWSADQKEWLKHLQEISKKYNFDHVTEHFGFMTGANFHDGAPVPIPFTPTTLRLGQDRLKRIAQVAACPVGLENLAFAYTLDDVRIHGDFLSKLLTPVNGFIILDLHNFYCHLHNFNLSYDTLIAAYDLSLVREIHISGGSWEDANLEPDRKVRRDTHDDKVPKEVFEFLEKTIPKCSNLKYIVLEQLGTGLKTEKEKQAFQDDFFTMEKIVSKHNDQNRVATIKPFLPPKFQKLADPFEDINLYHQQIALSNVFETATDTSHAQELLGRSDLANSEWQVEKWDPVMLETVIQIAQKWAKSKFD